MQELSALAAAEADTAAALQTISSSTGSSSRGGYLQCGCDDEGGAGSSSCCLDCNTYVTPAWWSLKVILVNMIFNMFYNMLQLGGNNCATPARSLHHKYREHGVLTAWFRVYLSKHHAILTSQQ
jgi:hypothetical protein